MANIPVPTQVNKFTTLETDFGTTICPALWIKAAQLAQYVHASFPIGMVMFFEASQDALPRQPDSRFWKLADGSTVTDPSSPMYGAVLPDFRNKFFRHAFSGEPLYSVGGADSVNLSHNHSGLTGEGTDWDSLRLDNGDERGQAIGTHQHTIANDLSYVTTIPAYHAVQVYVRIA